MFEVGSTLTLTDGTGRDIGSVRVVGMDSVWVWSDFTPGFDFAEVEPLFREFVELVNAQAISLLDPVMDAMAQLEISLTDGTPLRDVQIDPIVGTAIWRPVCYAR